MAKISPRIKEIIKYSLWLPRYLSAYLRSKPDFLVIGAQKAGTTSLYSYLSDHPQIAGSKPKEVHFFDGGIKPGDNRFERGEHFYRSHFPLKPVLKRNTKCFEATPLYLFHPLAADRIKKLYPDVKLIAILRDPVERAISQYFYTKQAGLEPLLLKEALEAEEDRLSDAIQSHNYNDESFIHHSYKARGIYKPQLERFFSLFHKEQIIVIPSDDLFSKPYETLNQIFKFIDVNPDFKSQKLQPKNVAKNKNHVDPDIIQKLQDFFRPHNQKLFDYLGWKSIWPY